MTDWRAEIRLAHFLGRPHLRRMFGVVLCEECERQYQERKEKQ